MAIGVVLVVVSLYGPNPHNSENIRTSKTVPATPTSVSTTAPETDLTRVNSFVISITLQFSNGAPDTTASRIWKREKQNLWNEIYPDGTNSYFDIVGRITVGKCPGSLAENQHAPQHQVFIPDKGCQGMPFYIRDGMNDWGQAAFMTDVK
jgi:hypothetical protein